jgi:hypothetical protein
MIQTKLRRQHKNDRLCGLIKIKGGQILTAFLFLNLYPSGAAKSRGAEPKAHAFSTAVAV